MNYDMVIGSNNILQLNGHSTECCTFQGETKNLHEEVVGTDAEEEIAFLLLDIRHRLLQPKSEGATQGVVFSKRSSFFECAHSNQNELLLPKSETKSKERKDHLKQEEKEEVEWSKMFDEEEEEEFLDEDDDEWTLTRIQSSSPVSALCSPSVGRGTRKKAPSGSACEKHKRWKKRCPDDCPMRKPKFRKEKSDEEPFLGSPELTDSLEDHMLGKRTKKPKQTAGSPKKKFRLNDIENEDSQACRAKGSSDEDSYRDRSPLSDSSCVGDLAEEVKPSKVTKGRKTRKSSRKYLPQACERHKMLHAKCPANCPDRIKRDTQPKK